MVGKESLLLENVSVMTLHSFAVDYPLFWKQMDCHYVKYLSERPKQNECLGKVNYY